MSAPSGVAAVPGRDAIAPLAADEREAAVELLTDAFADGPLDTAVVGGSLARRRRACRAGMASSLEAAWGRAELWAARREGELRGLLVGVPPEVQPLPPPSPWRQLRSVWRQGLRAAGRWREVWELTQAHRPEPPSWHLSLLAVTPESQGQGIGTALLGHWLARLDAQGQPAWLETSRADNVRFYQRSGFAVRQELEAFGVPIWQMVRAVSAP